MSRDQTPETAPKGGTINDYFYFLLKETFRKIDAALNRTEERVTDVEQAEGTVRPPSLFMFPIGIIGTVAVDTWHRLDYPPFSGQIIAAAGWPSPTGALGGSSWPGESVQDRVFDWTWANSAVGGDQISMQVLGSLPDGFTGWLPEAVVLRYGLVAQGLTAGSDMTINIKVANLTNHTYTHTANGAGSITTGFIHRAVFTAEDMAGGEWLPGAPFWLTLTLNRDSAAVTSGTLELGRLEVNWR